MSILDEMEVMEQIAELRDLIDSDEDGEEERDGEGMEDESSDMLITVVPRLSSPEEEEEEEEEDDDEEEGEEEDEHEHDDDDDDDDDEVLYTEEDLGYEDLDYEDQVQFTAPSAKIAMENNAEYDATTSSDAALRRISSLRASRAETGNSCSSAPEGSSTDSDLYVEAAAQRRSTFAGPPGRSTLASPSGRLRDRLAGRVSSRRSNINLGSVVAAPPGMNSLNMSALSEVFDAPSGSSDSAGDGGATQHGTGNVLQKLSSTIAGSARRATAMKSARRSATTNDLNSIQQAASKLESGPDSVFAAASVVAHSAATAAKRGHVQFNTDDPVLCMLTLLNVTSPGDDTESFTVSPVNIHGYPPGEGKIEMERQGPYVFVLAFVKFVHFDEDERYYTVVRADNGTEQRADTGKNIRFRFRADKKVVLWIAE